MRSKLRVIKSIKKAKKKRRFSQLLKMKLLKKFRSNKLMMCFIKINRKKSRKTVRSKLIIPSGQIQYQKRKRIRKRKTLSKRRLKINKKMQPKKKLRYSKMNQK
jgi:hypothetical protein